MSRITPPRIHPPRRLRALVTYLKPETDELLALAATRHSLEEIYSTLALDQLITPPPIRWDHATLRACDDAFGRYVAPGGNARIPRGGLGVPVAVFLDYSARHHGLLLHGSGTTNLGVIAPQSAIDNLAGGETAKIHAADTAAMALYFAVIDRPRLLTIPCVPAISALQAPRLSIDGEEDAFWFVVDYRAMPYQPWRDGTVYILPRSPFRDEHRRMQWSSSDAVPPLARIDVTPADFPLLGQVYGMDFAEDHRRANAGIPGFPWRGDPAVYPDPRYRPLP